MAITDEKSNLNKESSIFKEVLELLQDASRERGIFYARDKKDPEQLLKPLEFDSVDLYDDKSSKVIVDFLLKLIVRGYALYVSVPNQPIKEINISGNEQQPRWSKRLENFFHTTR